MCKRREVDWISYIISKLRLLFLLRCTGFLVDRDCTGVGAVAEENDLYGNIITIDNKLAERTSKGVKRVSYRYLREYGLGRVSNAQTMSLFLPPIALRTR